MSQEIINNLNEIKTANDLIKILKLTPLISPNMAIFSAVSNTLIISVINKSYSSYISFMMTNNEVAILLDQFNKHITEYESSNVVKKHCYNLMDIYYNVNSSKFDTDTNRNILMKLQDKYSKEIRITQDYWNIDIFPVLFNDIGLVRNNDITSEKHNKRYYEGKIAIKSSVDRNSTFPIWFLIPINFDKLIIEASSFEILQTPMQNLISMYKENSSFVYINAIEKNPAAFVECFRTLGAINDKQTTMAVLRGLLNGNDKNLEYSNLYAMRGCLGELSMKPDIQKEPETYSEYRHLDIRNVIEGAYQLKKHEIIVYMSTFVKTPYTLFSTMGSGFRSSFDVIRFMYEMSESRDGSFFEFCIECVEKIINTPRINIHKDSRDSFAQYKYQLQINTDNLKETSYIDVFKRINTLLVKSNPGTDLEENYEITKDNNPRSLVMIEGIPDADFDFYGDSFYIFYDGAGTVRRVDEKKKKKNFTKHIASKTSATYDEIMSNENHYYHDFLNKLKKNIPGFTKETEKSMKLSTNEEFLKFFKFNPLENIEYNFGLISSPLKYLSQFDMIRLMDLTQSLYESIEFMEYRNELKKIMGNIDTIFEHHQASSNISTFMENARDTIHEFILKYKLVDDENMSKFKNLPASFKKKEQIISFFQPVIDFYKKRTLSALRSFSRYESDARKIVLKNLYDRKYNLYRIKEFFNDLQYRENYNKNKYYSPDRFYEAMENSYNDIIKLLTGKNSPLVSTYNEKAEFSLLRIMEVYKKIISYTDNYLPTIIREKAVKKIEEKNKNKFANLAKEEKREEEQNIKIDEMYFDFFLIRSSVRREERDMLKNLILALHAKLLMLKRSSTRFQNPYIGNTKLIDGVLSGEKTKNNFPDIENKSTGPVYYLILLETRDLFLDFTKNINEFMVKTFFNLKTSMAINLVDIENTEVYVKNTITTKNFFDGFRKRENLVKDDRFDGFVHMFSENTLFKYAPMIGNFDSTKFFDYSDDQKEKFLFSKLLSKNNIEKYIGDLFEQKPVPDIEKIYRIMNIRFSNDDKFLILDYVIQSMKVALKYIGAGRRSTPEIREYSGIVEVNQTDYFNDDNNLFDKTKEQLMGKFQIFVSDIIKSIDNPHLSNMYSSLHSIYTNIRSKIPDTFENIDKKWSTKGVYFFDKDISPVIEETVSKFYSTRFLSTKEQYHNDILENILTFDSTDSSDMKKYIKACFEQIMLNKNSFATTLKDIFISDFLPSATSDVLSFDKQYFYKNIVISEMREKNYDIENIGKVYENINHKYGKQFKIPDWRDIYNFAKKQLSDKNMIIETKIIGSAPDIISKNYQLVKNDYVNVFIAKPKEKSRKILLLISISDKDEFFYDFTLNFNDMKEEKTSLEEYTYDDEVEEQGQTVIEEIIEETEKEEKKEKNKKTKKNRNKVEKKEQEEDDSPDDDPVKRILKKYKLKKFSGYNDANSYPAYSFTPRYDIPIMTTLPRNFFDYETKKPDDIIDKNNNLYYHMDKSERLEAILFYYFKSNNSDFHKNVYDYLHGLYTKYMFYAYSSKFIQLPDEKGVDVYYGFRKQEITEKINIILYYFDQMVFHAAEKSTDLNAFFNGDLEKENTLVESEKKSVYNPIWFLKKYDDSDDDTSDSSSSDSSSSSSDSEDD